MDSFNPPHGDSTDLGFFDLVSTVSGAPARGRLWAHPLWGYHWDVENNCYPYESFRKATEKAPR